MKEYYSISTLVIFVVSAVLSVIMCINEDISVKLTAAVVFAFAALVASIVLAPVSRLMIAIGDRITNKPLQVLYYVALLPLILIVVFLLYIIIQLIYECSGSSGEFGAAIGGAILVVFLCAVCFIALIVPYVQSLFVLLLRAVFKDKDISRKKG